MATPPSHTDCREYLRTKAAELGLDVTVSTAPPLIATAYDQTPIRCPHGTTYHLAPTSEQIAEWAEGGVA